MKDRILALVDGSGYSESVCHYSAWIAARLPAEVEILHVLGRRETAAAQDLSGALRLGARSKLLNELAELDMQRAKLARAQGKAILEDARAIVEGDGVTGVSTRLMQGDLVGIVQQEEATGLRAIVIGKRGEAADFATGHLGSNLDRVLRATRLPLLIAARAFRPVNRVLVGYDDSASANAAIERMAASPVFRDLSVVLVLAGPQGPAMKTHLAAAAARLHRTGIAAETRLVEGEPEQALQKLVEDEGFDLLVLGSHGHSRIRSLIVGSTTMAMVQACKVPVLVYR